MGEWAYCQGADVRLMITASFWRLNRSAAPHIVDHSPDARKMAGVRATADRSASNQAHAPDHGFAPGVTDASMRSNASSTLRAKSS